MRSSIQKKLYWFAAAAMLALVVSTDVWWREHFSASFLFLNGSGREFLAKTLFYVRGKPVRIFFLLKTTLFLVFLVLVSRAVRRVIQWLTKHHPTLGEHRSYILSRFASFLIYAVGILIYLHVEQISLGTLIVLGGTLGLGIGFGLQSLVSNLVAGVILLVEQPIRLGDRIEFGDKAGEVVHVGGRSSWIRTYDNAIVVIPNSEFVTKQVLNWTMSDPKTRLSFSVAVAYGSDPEKVMRILLEETYRHPQVMGEPAPSAFLNELGPSAMVFTARMWTVAHANTFSQIRSDIYLQVLPRFENEGIRLPFPQLDVHLQPSKLRAPVKADE